MIPIIGQEYWFYIRKEYNFTIDKKTLNGYNLGKHINNFGDTDFEEYFFGGCSMENIMSNTIFETKEECLKAVFEICLALISFHEQQIKNYKKVLDDNGYKENG